MITISGTLSKGWLAEALGVAFDREYYLNPERRYELDCRCQEYAAEQFSDLQLFYSESNLGQFAHWDKQQVLVGGIQPNMILGVLLGAEFVAQNSADADITPGCLAGKGPGDLPPPELLLDQEWVRLFDEQIQQVQNDPDRELRPIPPFFWDVSGRATIHGMLTTAQKLFGEAFFMDMISDPQRSQEIMEWITSAYIVLCRHFSETADLPITGVHVGECSACMVGPEQIERFVVPVTSRIGEALGPVRLHSCGPSTDYLEIFANISNLHSLDLGGDTSLVKARELFGAEMPMSISPMPWDLAASNPEPILDWAQRIIGDNDGGNLEILYHLEPDYNLENIYTLTHQVQT